MSASISPVSSPSKNGTPVTLVSRRSSMRASTGAENCSGAHGIGLRPLVPAVEGRVVAGLPGLAQPRLGEVPVRADLGRNVAQVPPELVERRPPPEPVAVVDSVHD